MFDLISEDEKLLETMGLRPSVPPQSDGLSPRAIDPRVQCLPRPPSACSGPWTSAGIPDTANLAPYSGPDSEFAP